jgi:hypothetical protein
MLPNLNAASKLSRCLETGKMLSLAISRIIPHFGGAAKRSADDDAVALMRHCNDPGLCVDHIA